MARYTVTGGAGFIGSHLVHRLVDDGHDVSVVDDLSTGRIRNLADVRDAIRFHEGSVSDPDLLREAFEGAEVVFHEAALASVQRSVDDPLATNRVNVEGTLQVLECARKSGARRVVFASSSSVYGDTPTLPKTEQMPASPKSPYAASKLTGEIYCGVYADLFGLETVALRYFNVFGPRQDPESQYAAVVPIFITALLRGESPTVFGDGEQSRDFTYVENVVNINLLAAEAPDASGQIFNVGCGERHTLNEMLAAIKEVLGTNVQAEYQEARAGDVRHSEADIQRARDVLGYRTEVDFEDGLRRTVEWYRENLL